MSSVASALPSQARAVIVGGGAVGCSVAYHLAKLGWTDVVLLEQGQLSCGTTWHAAGVVGQLRTNQGHAPRSDSTELYGELERETGLATGWNQCGGVTVARTQARMTQLRRTADMARRPAWSASCSPRRRRRTGGRSCGPTTWSGRSGCRTTPRPTRPTSPRRWLGARGSAARIFERTKAPGVTVAEGRVTGVRRRGRHRVRVRGQLRRAVGQAVGGLPG